MEQKDTTQGVDIKNTLFAVVGNYYVPIKKLISVVSDSAPAMRALARL